MDYMSDDMNLPLGTGCSDSSEHPAHAVLESLQTKLDGSPIQQTLHKQMCAIKLLAVFPYWLALETKGWIKQMFYSTVAYTTMISLLPDVCVF